MASESNCSICGANIVQGSCSNKDCENCSMVMGRTLDTDALCHKIAEVLAAASGEFIAEIANKVLSDKVTYEGDSLFTVEEA